MATHFPLLSYHVDTSNWTFQEAQDVGFTKMYGRNCHPEWYQYPNFQGLAHGLIGLLVLTRHSSCDVKRSHERFSLYGCRHVLRD